MHKSGSLLRENLFAHKIKSRKNTISRRQITINNIYNKEDWFFSEKSHFQPQIEKLQMIYIFQEIIRQVLLKGIGKLSLFLSTSIENIDKLLNFMDIIFKL